MYFSFTIQADVIFMSPPWGGLDYNSSSYSLEDLARSLGEHPRDMLLLARSFAPNVILYLPKSTDIDEVSTSYLLYIVVNICTSCQIVVNTIEIAESLTKENITVINLFCYNIVYIDYHR